MPVDDHHAVGAAALKLAAEYDCAVLAKGGHAEGDPVQPRPQRAGLADRPRPADQDEERGLERVLRVLRVAGDAPADAEHERPVPPDQFRERLGVLRGGEAGDEYRVRLAGRPQLPQDFRRARAGHASASASYSPPAPGASREKQKGRIAAKKHKKHKRMQKSGVV